MGDRFGSLFQPAAFSPSIERESECYSVRARYGPAYTRARLPGASQPCCWRQPSTEPPPQPRAQGCGRLSGELTSQDMLCCPLGGDRPGTGHGALEGDTAERGASLLPEESIAEQ